MFPNYVTNAKGQTVHQVFDPGFGVMTDQTDADGQTTTTRYDQFGRIKKVIYPDTSTEDYIYHIEPGNHHVTVTASQSPERTIYYDNYNRVVREQVNDGSRTILARTIYDKQGRVKQKSLPFASGNDPDFTIFEYDVRNRIIRRTNPDGTFYTIDYQGFEEIITNKKNQVTRRLLDSLGRLTAVTEPTTGVTRYRYDLFDNLTRVQAPLGAETIITYDKLGRKTYMADPYMGHWEYRYDVNGNLIWQKDGQEREVELAYDELDRIETKTHRDTNKIVKYTYDQERDGHYNIGLLTTLTTTEQGALFNTITYNYDRMGRAEKKTRTIDGRDYTTQREFDLAGRVKLITYPQNSVKVEYGYTAMGNLDTVTQIKPDGSRSAVVQYNGYNALGQIGRADYGNGAVTAYKYYPKNHRLEKLETVAVNPAGERGQVQNLTYGFDNLGNVETITDARNGVTHSFTYDDVNRLKTAAAAGNNDADRLYNQTYTYDLAGNMTGKEGKGGFNVAAWQDESKHLRPKAVKYNADVTVAGKRSVAYDQDNMPVELSYKGKKSYLYYDGEGARVKKVAGGQTTVYVGGLYEKRGDDTIIHIYAGALRVASIKNGKRFFTHADHLGSTTLTTDDSGRLVEEIGYLPFGATLFRNAYRNGVWTSVYRFTGQEYDKEFELYNYNARLYDPVMGRFITPDTVVPDWTNPQSLNRYAYCLNNPLNYVDPSGNFFLHILAGIAIGAALGATTSAMVGGNVGEGALTGAISGAFFGLAGAAGGGPLLHTWAGAYSGMVNALLTGGDPGMGFVTGGISGGIGAAMGPLFNTGAGGWVDFGTELAGRSLTGGFTGGIAAVMYGGNFGQGFKNGAMTAAFGYLCNETALFTAGNLLYYGGWGIALIEPSPFGEFLMAAGTAALAMSKLPGPRFIVNDVDDFMESQKSRLNVKLGKKIGKGQLPYERGPGGKDQAVEAVRNMLKNPTRVSDMINKANVRGDYDLIHVYSSRTNHTVSLRVLGNGNYEFDTLIYGISSKF